MVPACYRTSGIQKIEPHSPLKPTLFLRCVPIKLRGSSPAFAPPFACRFDEPGTLQGTPETRFVQAFIQQQLVHVLELAQGESGWEKPEGDWGLIQPALDGARRCLDHRPLPGGKGREIPNREPRIASSGRRGLMWHESHISDGHIGIARVPLPVAKCADLLHPDRR